MIVDSYRFAAASAPFPVVESTASNIFNAGTTDFNCVMTMPSGIVAGDFLLHHFGYNNNNPSPVIGATGWTILLNSHTVGSRGHMVCYKTAAGSDSLTVTNDTGKPSAGRTWRISGAASIYNSSNATATADFPALTPAGGSAKYLWFVLSAAGIQASTAPTDFGNALTVDSTFGGPKTFSARRDFEGSTLDPATTNVSQDALVTLAIKG